MILIQTRDNLSLAQINSNNDIEIKKKLLKKVNYYKKKKKNYVKKSFNRESSMNSRTQIRPSRWSFNLNSIYLN